MTYSRNPPNPHATIDHSGFVAPANVPSFPSARCVTDLLLRGRGKKEAVSYRHLGERIESVPPASSGNVFRKRDAFLDLNHKNSPSMSETKMGMSGEFVKVICMVSSFLIRPDISPPKSGQGTDISDIQGFADPDILGGIDNYLSPMSGAASAMSGSVQTAWLS